MDFYQIKTHVDQKLSAEMSLIFTPLHPNVRVPPQVQPSSRWVDQAPVAQFLAVSGSVRCAVSYPNNVAASLVSVGTKRFSDQTIQRQKIKGTIGYTKSSGYRSSMWKCHIKTNRQNNMARYFTNLKTQWFSINT